MKKIRSKALCLTIFLLLVFSPVLCLGQERDLNLKKEKESPIFNLATTYAIILSYIEQTYYQELTPEQIESIRKIQEESLSKIVSDLDKYSYYHKAEEWKVIKEDLQGKFEGVGLKLNVPDIKELDKKLTAIIKEKIPGFDSEDFKNLEFLKAIYKWIAEINPEAKELHNRIKKRIIPEGGILIEEVIAGGPAEKTGLKNKKGWFITKVDGKKLEGMALKDAIKLIKGPSGTKVKLTLTPPKEEKNKMPITVEITRGVIETRVISTGRMVNDEIGYVKFGDFYEGVDLDFKNNVAWLKERGMKKLIIDLRDNPGGYLDAADKLLEVLLPGGRIEIYALGRNGQLEPFYSPPENKVLKIFSGKIAVLINENSASASELVAISLKEQLSAVIIGKKSFGKGTIQTLFPLPDGSALRLTTGHYLSPVLGEDIDGKGVVPDIEIVDNPDTPEDEVIQKAIEELKK